MANITVIPATIQRSSAQTPMSGMLRRTAGYARVSTDSEEQLTSYEAQVDYYTRYITEHDGWDFVGIYTDEGITATNTKRREGFNRMIQDALTGKIDLIITKSVSRFARNTVDSLSAVRKLKDAGVEVYFEKENIYTFDGKGELLITIMSSLAQEESRSISENVTWGQRKRFSDGKVSMPYKHFLGYDKGKDGRPVVNEDEAETVKRIYRLFLEGLTPHTIATELTDAGVPTPGRGARWHSGTVRSILTNEKYKGDALLQKCFTVDFLTKKQKVNEGEVPQYYVEDSHPAIIDSETWDFVQYEMERRQNIRYSGTGIFAGRIFCGDCGGMYGAKKWHSTSKYSRTVYQCNDKFKGEKCATPHLYENDIMELFVTAVNRLLDDKTSVISGVEAVIARLMDTAVLDAEAKSLTAEIEIATGLVQKLVSDNADVPMDQGDYTKRYDALVERFDIAKVRLAEVTATIADKQSRLKLIRAFIRELRGQDALITKFDEHLWHSLLDKVTVYSKDDVRFTFKDGSVIAA